METSFGSELLLLSGTRPSPPDLELENDDMEAEGDLDDDEGEDVAVAGPPVEHLSSARGGNTDGVSAIVASLWKQSLSHSSNVSTTRDRHNSYKKPPVSRDGQVTKYMSSRISDTVNSNLNW